MSPASRRQREFITQIEEAAAYARQPTEARFALILLYNGKAV